jgi:HSP20 family protein
MTGKALIPRNLLPTTSLFPTDDIFTDFDNFFRKLQGFQEDGWQLSGFPQGDIVHGDTGSTVELMLAGYDKDQLKIEVSEGCLVVSADKCEEEGGKTFSRRARRSFTRKFPVGEGYNLEAIDAEYKNGLLSIFVPFREKKEKEKKLIDIK